MAKTQDAAKKPPATAARKRSAGNGSTKTPAKPAVAETNTATVTAESDKAAEAAMNAKNGTTEPVAETETVTEENGTTKLPANEYNFLQEIMKSPITDDRYNDVVEKGLLAKDYSRDNLYEISKEAPGNVFGEKESKKTLAQSVRNRLVSRDIIKVIDSGSPSMRTVIEVLNSDVSLSESGRATRRGRPPGSKTTKKGATATVTTSRSGRKPAAISHIPEPGTETVEALRNRLFRDENRIEGFISDYEKMTRKYPDLMVAAGIPLLKQ